MKKTEESPIDIKVKESEIETAKDDINIRKIWVLLGVLESNNFSEETSFGEFQKKLPTLGTNDNIEIASVKKKLMEIIEKL